MVPTFLITFREVIEASLIVATILGILTKVKARQGIRTVWLATGSAFAASLALLVLASAAGLKAQELYSGRAEQLIEGALMIISALFITYAVFFLHRHFAPNKARMLSAIDKTVKRNGQPALFFLVFTAVLREGIEIVLFLSTLYIASDPQTIVAGFFYGSIAGLFVSGLLFSATVRLPITAAFRTVSMLLILFAAGLLVRGIHELSEAAVLPDMYVITTSLLPADSTFVGATIQSLFGIHNSMNLIQLLVYVGYVSIMTWWVFVRKDTVEEKGLQASL